MVDMAVDALNMVDSNLVIATNDYAPGASDIHLALTTPIATFLGLRRGSRKVTAGDTTGQLVIKGVQDLETANSLMLYSITNRGQVKTVLVKLATDGTHELEIDVLVIPPDTMGGAVGATTAAEATWTWEIIGDPFAAPAAP